MTFMHQIIGCTLGLLTGKSYYHNCDWKHWSDRAVCYEIETADLIEDVHGQSKIDEEVTTNWICQVRIGEGEWIKSVSIED